jgi:hypothetical protein
MKALIYTYQGEEFAGNFLGTRYGTDNELWARIHLESGNYADLRFKDVRAIITDLPGGTSPETSDPPSGDASRQPSEPPSNSSVPEGT